MSTLSVHDLQGFSTYNNTVRVPSGHTFSVDGRITASSELQVPNWTDSTRPAIPVVGLIGYNTETTRTEIYTGSIYGWVTLGTAKNDGTAAERAVTKSTEILQANPAAPTGWYWMIIDGQAKEVWVDNEYDGGGWVLVASHPYGVNLQPLTYAEAAQSYDWYATSTYGSGDPKSYSIWAGLRAWDQIAFSNSAGRNVVYYVAPSQVPLGSISSHTKRSRWSWNGWTNTFAWAGTNSLVNEVGGTPGIWSYHIAGNYSFTTYDNDQDVYSSNCSTLYNNAPWWYGACWSGNFWGGNGTGYQPAAFWDGSGSDYHQYGGIYVK